MSATERELLREGMARTISVTRGTNPDCQHEGQAKDGHVDGYWDRAATAIRPSGRVSWHYGWRQHAEVADALIAGPLAPILDKADSAAAAEARADRLSAEVEALRDDRAEAERTLEQWFDTKAKSVEQVGPKLAEALGGYLRVCRCGGMHLEQSELVEAVLEDFLRRQAGSIIAPVIEVMVSARTALARAAVKAETEDRIDG